MKLLTKWIVSKPFEPAGYNSYSGYSDEEITQTFKHFNPDRKILFISDSRNEAMAFYDGFIGIENV